MTFHRSVLRTFDNIASDSYPVCPVGKIGGSNKGVWSEIIFLRARKVSGTSTILLAGHLAIFPSGLTRYRSA